MTSTMLAPAAGGPALRERVRELAPAVSARSLEIEQARTLPPDLVSELREAGLFRLATPVSLGGGGVAPRTIVEVVEELSRADGATGWCVLIANIGGAFLGWLEPGAAERIVTGNPDVVVAGGLAPLGQATLDGDTYRLTGRWQFGSGCLHSDWFMGGFMVMDGGRPKTNQWGMPEMRLAYFPTDQATVEDTWRVAGLAGTGSHDVVAEGVVVPAEYTSVPYFGRAGHPDPLCRLSAYNLLLTLMAGFPLGVARRALDEARAQLADRPRPAGDTGWLDDPAVQVTLLRHETALAAARRHVLDTLDELLDQLGEGTGEGSYPERARLAAAIIHAYDAGREAVLDCFRLAGAGALFDDNPLQRCMRDLVAGSQHVAFSADSRKRVANALLGLQTTPVFFGV
jgi:alkylation response protein AidB-like acyl-CoA dehydrogenase